jgi:myo-inositol-1(or 4)-monophosphatase
MKTFFDAVVAANIEILELIENNSDEYLHQSYEIGAGGDISTKIDLLAEEIFIKYLSEYGNIYSEESGFIDNGLKDEIIIDPIDGSNNFASNLPYYGTSVALKSEGRCKEAIIVNLANGEIFVKNSSRFEKGNIKKLIFQKVVKNPFSKLGLFERTYCSKSTPELMRKHHIKYRSPGAFALSLAYAHEVNFVHFEGEMREYDIAAGLYMCEDLCIKKTDKLLLVSKDKEIFDKISQFI